MPQPASSPTTTATPRRRLHRPVLLIVGIMLIAANLRAALTSVGPLLEQIQQQLALSATAAGLINSLPLILFAVLAADSGAGETHRHRAHRASPLRCWSAASRYVPCRKTPCSGRAAS